MFAPFFHSYFSSLFPATRGEGGTAQLHRRHFPRNLTRAGWGVTQGCGTMITIMDAAHKIIKDISLIDVQHARPAVRTSTTPGSGLGFIALNKNRHSWIIHEEDIYFYCLGGSHLSWSRISLVLRQAHNSIPVSCHVINYLIIQFSTIKFFFCA